MNTEDLKQTRQKEFGILQEEILEKRPQILGKGDLRLIQSKSFSHDLVVGYELYLREEDLDKTPKLKKLNEGTILGGHGIKFLEWNGRQREVDLSDKGPFGDKSEEQAKKTIDFIKMLGGSYVVFHIGNFLPDPEWKNLNSQEEVVEKEKAEKNQRILQAAERITRLSKYTEENGLILAVENDADWVLATWNQEILDNPQALSLFLSHVPERVKLIIDEEHLYRSATFGTTVWNKYLINYLSNPDQEKTAEDSLEELHAIISQLSEDEIKKKYIFPFVEKMVDIAGDRIFGLHVCGWDFRKDATDLTRTPEEEMSTHDAHLPPRRVIDHIGNENILLRDTIDHRHTLQTILNKIGIDNFRELKIVLEYSRNMQNRYYHLASSGVSTQEQAKEFEIAGRSMRHLVSRTIQGFNRTRI